MTPILLRDALLDALALILPTECVACREPDRAICAACTAGLRPPPTTILRISSDPPLPVWSALPYDGVAKPALSAFKESGRTDVARALAAPLASAIQDARHELARDLPPGVALELVPAPSSPRAYRSRGYRPVDLLVRAARSSLTVTPALTLARSVRDQAGLGVDDRRRNMAGAIGIGRRFCRGRLRGRQLLLIDDVVTTGSTLLACREALEHEGATVWGAATLAFTSKRRGTSRVEVVGQVDSPCSGRSDDTAGGEDYGGSKGAEELALSPRRRVF